MKFEGKNIVWNEQKARSNIAKHGIKFELAAEIFFDPLSLTVDDADHSWQEQRFITIGKSTDQKLVVVFYVENEIEIRIISARRPTRTERLNYEEGS